MSSQGKIMEQTCSKEMKIRSKNERAILTSETVNVKSKLQKRQIRTLRTHQKKDTPREYYNSQYLYNKHKGT